MDQALNIAPSLKVVHSCMATMHVNLSVIDTFKGSLLVNDSLFILGKSPWNKHACKLLIESPRV